MCLHSCITGTILTAKDFNQRMLSVG